MEPSRHIAWLILPAIIFVGCIGGSNYQVTRVAIRLQEIDQQEGAEQPSAVQRVLERQPPTGMGGAAPAAHHRQILHVRPEEEEPDIPLFTPSLPTPPVAERLETLADEEFLLPLTEPRITSPFGWRRDPFRRRQRRMHRGTDFGAPSGTPVYATASGIAIMAGWCDANTGNCVVIVHPNGWRSQYFHLERVDIRCGRKVVRGQQIGAVGSTGRSTGPHLHFQLSQGGEDVDPMTVIGHPLSQ
ncbi:MAG: M23 family metallopeptidase [Bradymonadales bacterium]|nr:M23 family metallopeptidase [Bradymonadales bacterium]